MPKRIVTVALMNQPHFVKTRAQMECLLAKTNLNVFLRKSYVLVIGREGAMIIRTFSPPGVTTVQLTICSVVRGMVLMFALM